MGRQRKSGGTFRVPTEALERKSSKIRSEKDEVLKVFDGIAPTMPHGDSDDDEPSDEEVFDLDIEHDGSDESDDDSQDDDTDSDIEDGDDESEENGIKALVDNLPAALRQKVLHGRPLDEDSDEEEDQEDQDESWGKKKAYWSGDTADLEIGQEMEDAEDEEKAAKALQRSKLSRMTESDFMGDDDHEDDEDDEEDNSDDDNLEAQSKQGRKHRDKVTSDLETLVLGNQSSAQKVELVTRDMSKLTKSQRLQALSAESPELLGLVTELRDLVEELRSRVQPLCKLFEESAKVRAKASDDIVDYLEVKQQLLVCYCTNMTFYLYLKSTGQSVRNHPVMRQLLELRYAMEKMRPLDGKLKYQVERLLKLGSLDADSDEVRGAALRPNPGALVGKSAFADDDDEDADEEAGDDGLDGSDIEDDLADSKKSREPQKLYKAPKIAAMPYKETEAEEDKKQAKIDRKRKKLKDSEIMEALREEFGTTPENSSSSGVAAQSRELRKLAEEADERRDFEEERFVRLTQTRKEKKKIRQVTRDAGRMANFEDIGDIGEFEELAQLTGTDGGASGVISGMNFGDSQAEGRGSGGAPRLTPAEALQQAVSAFVQSSGKTGKAAKSGSKSDDTMAPLPDPAARKRTKSKFSMDETDDSQTDRFGGSYDDADDEGGGDDFTSMLAGGAGRKRRGAPSGRMNDDDVPLDDEGGDDGLLETFARKKKDFLKKKQEHYTAEPRYGSADADEVDNDSGKRGITYEIMKNKGLTPHRSKLNRNPRVKKREKFKKAVIARKGQVREVIQGAAGAYGGEETGIRANIAKSRKISN